MDVFTLRSYPFLTFLTLFLLNVSIFLHIVSTLTFLNHMLLFFVSQVIFFSLLSSSDFGYTFTSSKKFPTYSSVSPFSNYLLESCGLFDGKFLFI